jgi:3-dehydroquinate dehydratase-2
MGKFLVIHGPNLNLLGQRAPGVYGKASLEEVDRRIRNYARENRVSVTIVQTNCEGGIVEAIQNGRGLDGLVINPAGYTHTSVAIRDAIEATGVRTVEVHLSNIYAREEFRHRSLIAPVCAGQIAGLGWRGYILALEYLRSKVSSSSAPKGPL